MLHKSFVELALDVKKHHPEIDGPLSTALLEIQANPTPGAMQGVVKNALQGVIHKKHVGGRGGFRMLYLLPKGKNFVIPVYVSAEERSNFDWDDIDWQGICEPVYRDYIDKNYSAFQNYRPK